MKHGALTTIIVLQKRHLDTLVVKEKDECGCGTRVTGVTFHNHNDMTNDLFTGKDRTTSIKKNVCHFV